MAGPVFAKPVGLCHEARCWIAQAGGGGGFMIPCGPTVFRQP